jgi:membrane-associated phospholipid phosphatase
MKVIKIKKTLYIPLGIYLALICASGVFLGFHTIFDVVGGVILGAVISLALDRLIKDSHLTKILTDRNIL